MRLLIIDDLNWRVCTPIKDGNQIDLLEYLENCKDSDAEGILSYFERFAQFGHDGFSTSQMHEANKNESIYEFSKGRHRILFFNIEGKAVVVSCGHIKKGQKANPKEVKKAIKIKNQYLEAYEKGLIQFIRQDE